MEIADRIAVMRSGRLIQDDVPGRVWSDPADRFVAELFGETDAIEAVAIDGGFETAFGRLESEVREHVRGQKYALIARPGSVRLETAPDGSARVVDIRHLGDRYLVIAESGAERLRAFQTDTPTVRTGDPVIARFARSNVLVYRRE